MNELLERIKKCKCPSCSALVALGAEAKARLKLSKNAAIRACELAVVAASGEKGLTETEIIAARRAYALHLGVNTGGSTQDPDDCRRIKHAIHNATHIPGARNPVNIGLARASQVGDRYFLLWQRPEGSTPFNRMPSLNSQPIAIPDDIESELFHAEGRQMRLEMNRYERDPRARSACIAIHGCRCHICNLQFDKMYGKIGRGYIHVHHVVPLANLEEAYAPDPKTDLVPLCANCHAMIHRRDPPYSIEELKDIVLAHKLAL